MRHLCKPETKSRVCITVENSPNPLSLYIRLCKHREKVFYCFYKITSPKNYNVGKKRIHFTDQSISSYNIYLTMAIFSTDQSKLVNISKFGDGVFTTCVSLCHTTVFTYSHATTLLSSSEHAYYLSYFIK